MDEPTGPVEQISAVTLLTADMAASVAFYHAAGFELGYGGADAEFTSFRVGSGFLNLALDPSHPQVGAVWGRVIFWVADVDDQHRRMIEAGYRPTTSPADASWGERYFHVRDPDGHEISFARPLR